ncbi:MAG: hypothetical protein HYS44_00110 [Candidatus Niyogibacteria bacterium]|nr:hypothetical protein [Candidatus Niyogibacteria bacterium]
MSHDEIIIAPLEESVKTSRVGWKRDAVIAVLFIVIALIAFGLGRLSVSEERTPIRIETSR